MSRTNRNVRAQWEEAQRTRRQRELREQRRQSTVLPAMRTRCSRRLEEQGGGLPADERERLTTQIATARSAGDLRRIDVTLGQAERPVTPATSPLQGRRTSGALTRRTSLPSNPRTTSVDMVVEADLDELSCRLDAIEEALQQLGTRIDGTSEARQELATLCALARSHGPRGRLVHQRFSQISGRIEELDTQVDDLLVDAEQRAEVIKRLTTAMDRAGLVVEHVGHATGTSRIRALRPGDQVTADIDVTDGPAGAEVAVTAVAPQDAVDPAHPEAHRTCEPSEALAEDLVAEISSGGGFLVVSQPSTPSRRGIGRAVQQAAPSPRPRPTSTPRNRRA